MVSGIGLMCQERHNNCRVADTTMTAAVGCLRLLIGRRAPGGDRSRTGLCPSGHEWASQSFRFIARSDPRCDGASTQGAIRDEGRDAQGRSLREGSRKERDRIDHGTNLSQRIESHPVSESTHGVPERPRHPERDQWNRIVEGDREKRVTSRQTTDTFPERRL
jgi:hypothetical protein